MSLSLNRTNVLILVAALIVTVGSAVGITLVGEPAAGPPTRAAADPVRFDLTEDGHVPLEAFTALLQPIGPGAYDAAVKIMRAHWRDSYAGMILEIMPFVRGPVVGQSLLRLLEDGTGQTFGKDLRAWQRWAWNTDIGEYPRYAAFKAFVYRPYDQRFPAYFREGQPASIRLDEIRWGGVRRDGIPPLVNPKMTTAAEAVDLDDSNVVFGLEINGDARAYPKRILAWHEMFKDTVGGVSVNGVYCTLCGSMILYRTEHEGVHHELGTSGFLYRSNKLMYDQATESLWSTTLGEPVVGPLVGKGIKLEPLYVVTTTWGKWRQMHPETTVLSFDTGHGRDYGEGVAYREYFSTDRLMFDVPKRDERLRNKAEVLALRFGKIGTAPSAISAKFLATRPVYHGERGGQRYVVLTDASGANRVYDAGTLTFTAYDGDVTATDDAGGRWTVTEAALRAADGRPLLDRLPAHRAFWFGWYAAHPDTQLVMDE